MQFFSVSSKISLSHKRITKESSHKKKEDEEEEEDKLCHLILTMYYKKSKYLKCKSKQRLSPKSSLIIQQVLIDPTSFVY